MRIASAALALVLLPGSGFAAQRSFRFQVDAGYPASLFYAVDKLTNADQSSSGDYYLRFWKETFGLSKAEAAAGARYAKLRARYDVQIGSRYNLGSKWPLIFVGSRDLDECWAKARRWLDDEDVEELREALAPFDARFRPLWDKHAARLAGAAAAFEAKGYRRSLPAFLDEAARFYELKPDMSRDYDLALVWHPGLKHSKNRTSGARFGRLMIVELPAEHSLDDQMDVVVHEFIHDLNDAFRPRLAAAPESAFPGCTTESRILFAQGFNEGFATAFGQALFMERHLPGKFRSEGSWYASDVDAYAKSIYPSLRDALAAGSTLLAEGRRWCEALRPLSRDVRVGQVLRSHMLLADPAASGASQTYWKALQVRDVYALDLGDDADRRELKRVLASEPQRPVLVMTEPEGLRGPFIDALEGTLDEATARTLRERGIREPVLARLGTSSGRLRFVLVGSLDQLERSAEAFARLPLPPVGTVSYFAGEPPHKR